MGGERLAMLAYFQERSSPYLNQENQSQKPALQTKETRMPYPIMKIFLQGIGDSRVIPPDPVKNSSMKKMPFPLLRAPKKRRVSIRLKEI